MSFVWQCKLCTVNIMMMLYFSTYIIRYFFTGKVIYSVRQQTHKCAFHFHFVMQISIYLLYKLWYLEESKNIQAK